MSKMRTAGKKILGLGGSIGVIYTGYISWLQYGDLAKDWLVHSTLGFPIRIHRNDKNKKFLKLNSFNKVDKIIDKDLIKMVENLNQLTHVINLQDFEIKDELIQLEVHRELEKVYQSILDYNEQYLNNIEENIRIGTKERLQQLEDKYKNDTEDKENLLNIQFAENFDKFKDELDSKYQDLLKRNLSANAEKLRQHYENEITLFSIKQTEEFNKLIDSKLNQERNNKLANLIELDSRIGKFGKSINKLNSMVIKNHITKRLVLQINGIQEKLNLYQLDSINLKPDIESLKLTISLYPNNRRCKKNCSCKKNGSCHCNNNKKFSDIKLMETIVKELENITSQDIILSNEQLVNNWNLLSTHFRTASLLPVNAGLMGHLLSKIFSLFQFTKTSLNEELNNKYNKIQENLILYKLNAALDDALDLNTPSRKICDGWIKHARRRFEVVTLLDLLNHEIKNLS